MEYPFKNLMPLDEATARTGYYKDWTHIDANAFHQISELVKFIREKGYGADTREAIAQALERVYHDALQSGNANMEVSLARKHFKDLASRLDASDDKLTSATAQLAQTEDKKVDKNGSQQVKWANIAQDAREQITGNQPPAVVGVNSVGTENLTNNAVTYDKTDYADEISFFVKNIIGNGNFVNDSNGDGIADRWSFRGAGSFSPGISGGKQRWLPSGTLFDSSLEFSDINVINGHKYFFSVEHSNINSISLFTNSLAENLHVEEEHFERIFESNTGGLRKLTISPRNLGEESTVANVVLVDLTATFGKGNEPTLSYFSYLLKKMSGNKWFSELNLTDVSKNLVVTAKDLEIVDGSNLQTNVNDMLIGLDKQTVKVNKSKNLFDPTRNIVGEITNKPIGHKQTIVDQGRGFLTQFIDINGFRNVVFRDARIYAITDENHNVLVTNQWVYQNQTYKLTASDIPNGAKYLWVSVYEDNKTQVEIGTELTPYDESGIDGLYVDGEKILDYPLSATGGSNGGILDYQVAQAELEKNRLEEEVNFLKANALSILNAKTGKNQSQAEIILKKNTKQKLILHLHKRESDGYDTINDVFLPNVEDDFSDIRITNQDGKILPYRVSFKTNEFDILADDRIGLYAHSYHYKDSQNRMISVFDKNVSISSDGGKSWSKIDALNSIHNPHVTLVDSDDSIFFSKDGILYKSASPYSSYTEVLDTRENYTGNFILASGMVEHPNGELFVGSYQIEKAVRIYRSTDSGLTWTKVYQTAEYQHVHSMYVDVHQNPVAVYAGLDGGGGVLRTTDKGETWVDLREQNPDMPQSTDFGVVYADQSGYRLIGGETSIVGGQTLLKTTDDINFKSVLSVGSGVYNIRKLDGKLFGGGVGTNGYTSAAVYMSEDEGETWEQVYITSPINDTNGASDGFRYVSVGEYAGTNEEQIIVGSQSLSRSPLRIYPSGAYAEVIVTVPDGSNKIIVEDGYAYTNTHPIVNDTNLTGSPVVYFPFNENSHVIKEMVSGRLFSSEDFEWGNGGRKLSNFYPDIRSPKDNSAIKVTSLNGFEVDSFDAMGGLTISFWSKNPQERYIEYLKTDDGKRGIINGPSFRFEGHLVNYHHPFTFDVFEKVDIVVKSNGDVESYFNGQLRDTKIGDNGMRQAITNSEKLTLLNPVNKEIGGYIQHFMIRKGAISSEQIYEEYNSYITDNIEQ